ncbi:putative 60s ribosomal protein l4-a [Golovinomyces cichoracearum]|uniref:Putative 60s ribosomal protein l4-a n=1 Tax=Golovinomyces cichoracearum TaxID=62708 RepID=A0A420HZR4_9PEZI|nr:putative 60s ribosomal protein l4-a [Golovinomyces cichoracearum]
MNMLQANQLTESLPSRDQALSTASQDLFPCGTKDQQTTISSKISSGKDEHNTNSSTYALPISYIKPIMENIPIETESLSQCCKEFDVPLPLITQVRNIYVESLRRNRDKLYSIIEDTPISVSRQAVADVILDDLRRLCDYSRLTMNDHSLQRQDLQIYEAKYAENISTKLIFIVELLTLIRSYNQYVIIIIRQDLIDVFEAIFQSHGFSYCRADLPEMTSEVAENDKKITLLPTSSEIKNIKPANLIIAFDSSYSQFVHSKEFEKVIDTFKSSAFLLHLIIYHSVEHLEKNLEPTTNIIYDKLRLLRLIYTIASNVGMLPREYPEPPDSARLIAEYLQQSETGALWPLPTLTEIDENIESTEDEDIPGLLELLEGFSEALHKVASIDSTPIKRLSEYNCTENPDSPKRQKTGVFPKKSTSWSQMMHKTNNFGDKCLDQSQNGFQVADNDVAFNKSNNGADIHSRDYVSLLLQKLNTLEIQLRKRDEREIELDQTNLELEVRCLDFESSFKLIQPKYQEAINDRGLFEHEKELALGREKSLRQTLESKEKQLAKTQEENVKILQDLKTAQEALSNSKIPEIAELQKMRLEITVLKTENERLQKQIKLKDSDYDYMQTNYQKVSTSAASLAQQIRYQEDEMKALKIKAGENAFRINQIQSENAINDLQLMIRGLRAEKIELERHVEKLSEQYNAIMCGHPNTRGSSVPRSPRLNACVSSLRPITRVVGGPNPMS